MSDAVVNKKLDLITDMRTLAKEMIELNARVTKAVRMQQTLQIDQTDIDTDQILVGSAHEGLSWSKISNVVGSFGAFSTETSNFFSTHGGNFREMSI